MIDVEIYQKACALSASLKQHVFDTLYHAVALTEPGTVFVIADEQYYRKAHRVGRIVQLKEFSVDLQIEGAGIIPIDGGSPGYNTAPRDARRVRLFIELV